MNPRPTGYYKRAFLGSFCPSDEEKNLLAIEKNRKTPPQVTITDHAVSPDGGHNIGIVQGATPINQFFSGLLLDQLEACDNSPD